MDPNTQTPSCFGSPYLALILMPQKWKHAHILVDVERFVVLGLPNNQNHHVFWRWNRKNFIGSVNFTMLVLPSANLT